MIGLLKCFISISFCSGDSYNTGSDDCNPAKTLTNDRICNFFPHYHSSRALSDDQVNIGVGV